MVILICELYVQDQESYQNFMQLVRADLENEYPNEDVDAIMKSLGEVSDMEPGTQIISNHRNILFEIVTVVSVT